MNYRGIPTPIILNPGSNFLGFTTGPYGLGPKARVLMLGLGLTRLKVWGFRASLRGVTSPNKLTLSWNLRS